MLLCRLVSHFCCTSAALVSRRCSAEQALLSTGADTSICHMNRFCATSIAFAPELLISIGMVRHAMLLLHRHCFCCADMLVAAAQASYLLRQHWVLVRKDRFYCNTSNVFCFGNLFSFTQASFCCTGIVLLRRSYLICQKASCWHWFLLLYEDDQRTCAQ